MEELNDEVFKCETKYLNGVHITIKSDKNIKEGQIILRENSKGNNKYYVVAKDKTLKDIIMKENGGVTTFYMNPKQKNKSLINKKVIVYNNNEKFKFNLYNIESDTEDESSNEVNNMDSLNESEDNIDTLFNLLKVMKYKSIDELFKYCKIETERKDLYEKIWDIIIKCGLYFPNTEYEHMNGNDLKTMNAITDFETYLKNTNTFGKTESNSSNIILKDKSNTWIFVSSKFYKDDSKKTIKHYDIKKIIKTLNKYKDIYTKYEIFLFVKDKQKVETIIENTEDTDESIRESIKCVMDYSDLEKYYLQLQTKLKDIDLTTEGEINREFINKIDDSSLIEKFKTVSIDTEEKISSEKRNLESNNDIVQDLIQICKKLKISNHSELNESNMGKYVNSILKNITDKPIKKKKKPKQQDETIVVNKM